jgi:hypothetical protein
MHTFPISFKYVKKRYLEKEKHVEQLPVETAAKRRETPIGGGEKQIKPSK